MYHAHQAKVVDRRCRRSGRRSFESPAASPAHNEKSFCYMRLPHPLLESQFFVFTSSKELVAAMGDALSEEEAGELRRLTDLGLPPVSSALALSTMLGINPGLLWSMLRKPRRHYRRFTIPKGRSERVIYAPRVALKIVQKWLSVHFEKAFEPLPHVYGFVRGKSHIQAAKIHTNAQWV